MAYYRNIDDLVLIQDYGQISKVDPKNKVIYISLENYYDIHFRSLTQILPEALDIAKNNPLKYKIILTCVNVYSSNRRDIFSLRYVSKTMAEMLLDVKEKLKGKRNIDIAYNVKDLEKVIEKEKASKKEKSKDTYYLNQLLKGKLPRNIRKITPSLYDMEAILKTDLTDLQVIEVMKKIKNLVVGSTYIYGPETKAMEVTRNVLHRSNKEIIEAFKALNFLPPYDYRKEEIKEFKEEVLKEIEKTYQISRLFAA